MKKIATLIKKKLREVSNTVETSSDKELQTLIKSLSESIDIFYSPVPSKNGFPFDLPVVEWYEKLIISEIFFQDFLKYLESKSILATVVPDIQNLLLSINTLSSPQILSKIRQIKTLFSYFLQLRQILSKHEENSNQIKNRIRLLLNQVKKYSKSNPQCLVIMKRLRKYWKNLFHGYEDKRIPLTNLGIERSFNQMKRVLRKRTGMRNRPGYFIYEGNSILVIQHLLGNRADTSSIDTFIASLTAQYRMLPQELYFLTKNTIQNEKLKSLDNYIRKYGPLQALEKFTELSRQFRFG
jgi:hypothetical protein